MVTAIIIGCSVATFRFLMDKWNITGLIIAAIAPRKFCSWCFLTWWPCVIACAIACLFDQSTIIYTPVASIVATIGYVYLKSQPE